MIADPVAHEAVRSHGCGQDPVELSLLLNIVIAMNPKVIVEIGSDTGGSLFAWASTTADVASLSLPPHDPARTCEAHGAYLIQGDSHHPANQEKLAAWLDGRSPDFTWIDGDHSEDGCRADWLLARRLKSRVVGFHDISPRRIPGDPGVRKVWAEAASRFPSVVVRNPEVADAPGAGVVWLT